MQRAQKILSRANLGTHAIGSSALVWEFFIVNSLISRERNDDEGEGML
jgi:hypothetical protein